MTLKKGDIVTIQKGKFISTYEIRYQSRIDEEKYYVHHALGDGWIFESEIIRKEK